jgi:predicted transposase/invertase (TIGR01784 family)
MANVAITLRCDEPGVAQANMGGPVGCSTNSSMNVEMQKTATPALRERLVYYTACLCSGPLEEGDDYTDLCPTIGICIRSTRIFPKVVSGHLKFTLNNLEHRLHFTDDFQIHTVELPKYNSGTLEGPAGASLAKWAWLFQRAEDMDAEQLRSMLPEIPFQKMIGILEMISKSEQQRHIYDSLQRAARDRAWREKAVELQIQEARREAAEEAAAEALVIGQRIGREEGLQIRQIRILEQLLDDHPTSDESLNHMTRNELHELVSKLKDRLNRRGIS